MNKADNLTLVIPSAAMSETELAEWDRLPASEQLARLRFAIDRGIASGVTEKTMDDVWDAAMARNPDARL